MHGPEPDGLRTPRQRELIRVATHLFAQRGYHAVGINEISGELGLTGPAFYRHYPSKEALLIAVLDDAISGHLEEVRDLVSSIYEPRETLNAIIANHVEFVFEHTENIMTWRTEFRMIPENDRHRLRYLQRLYTEEWVRTLRQLRPELEVDQVRAMCHAAIALLQSPTEFHNKLSRAEVTPILISMATPALMGTEPPAPAGSSVPTPASTGAAR
jgi:AcrR family transcriptional regulator